MSLTTLSGIRDFVKTSWRITNTDLDDFIDQQINENYNDRAAIMPWKDTIIQGTTFATASTQQDYNLASDFMRLVPNSVRWGASSTSQGPPIPDIPYEQSEYWKGAYSTSQPSVCCVVGATTGSGRCLKLIPPFTTSSSVVSYDYYATVAALTADTSALRVVELGPVVAYDTLGDVAAYDKDFESETRHRKRANDSFKAAFQNVLPSS